VDVAYEPALAPELVIDTANESVPAATARIIALARRLAGDDPTNGAIHGSVPPH
jgi:hypothetical protein